MLFALYVADMSRDLDSTDLGFQLSDKTISTLFFADDIVLISRTRKGLLNLISLVKKNCDSLKMEISIKKSQVVSPSDDPFTIFDQYGDEILSLERVTQYRYLGLDTYGSMFRTGVERQRSAITTAQRYKGACASISHRGPDIACLALSLWTGIAIPSILYGCNSIPFSSTNIETIERIQAQMAKTVLGLNISAPNICCQTECGIRPFRMMLWRLQLKSYARWLMMGDERWPNKALMEHVRGEWKSP